MFEFKKIQRVLILVTPVELWYLVKYEDDENLRVLAEEEVRHIFPDDEEDNEMQVGDIVNALWIPNGKYFDAKILNKGGESILIVAYPGLIYMYYMYNATTGHGFILLAIISFKYCIRSFLIDPKSFFTADKNELMKERMRLEKEKKNGNKGQEPKAQKKRKHPEGDKENQKKKKKQESTESAKEKEQAVQNKEEKRKKKEQEQERQKMMLEARKAQAISRWVASTTATTHNDEVTIVNDSPSVTFTPQPLRQANSSNQSPMTPARIAYTSGRTPSTTPESMQSTIQESSVANLTVPGSSTGTKSFTRTPNTSVISTPGSVQSKQSSSAANPKPAATKTKGTREPKRGLHFQSAIADNSDDEMEEEVEGEQILEDADAFSSDCCKEQRMEIKALRKRLEKVHKRLNIACKFPLSEFESSMFSAAHQHTCTSTCRLLH